MFKQPGEPGLIKGETEQSSSPAQLTRNPHRLSPAEEVSGLKSEVGEKPLQGAITATKLHRVPPHLVHLKGDIDLLLFF